MHAAQCSVAQSCPPLFDTMDCSPPGSSVHGILQARILQRVAMPSSRESSQPRDPTRVSCIAGRFFNNWATTEAHTYAYLWLFSLSAVKKKKPLVRTHGQGITLRTEVGESSIYVETVRMAISEEKRRRQLRNVCLLSQSSQAPHGKDHQPILQMKKLIWSKTTVP